MSLNSFDYRQLFLNREFVEGKCLNCLLYKASAFLFSFLYIYIITYFFEKIKKDFLFSLTAYTLLQWWVLPIVLYYLLHRIPHIHNSRRVTGLKNCTGNPFSISFLHIYYNIFFYKNQKRFSRRIFLIYGVLPMHYSAVWSQREESNLPFSGS